MASSPLTSSSTVQPTSPRSQSAPTQVSSSPDLNNMSHLISFKLDGTNYLLWKDQLVPILKSRKLYKYVDSDVIPPSLTDPTYDDWECVDQTLLSWINATLTEAVFSEVHGLPTSRAVWEFLEAKYASQHAARAIQLRLDLQQIQRGNQSINEYLLKIKRISDALNSSSSPVPEVDLIFNTLRGLGPDYAAFYAAITTQPTLPSFVHLQSLLLQYESHLHHMQTRYNNPTDLQSSTVFYAQQNSPPTYSSSSSQGCGGRGSYGGRGGRGPGRGGRNQGRVVIC
ncbi:hypothetical protein BVC80_989g24 [Macleaya cordata]|uniref:Retrotransposon Copia-like N-terminal domain-containing protein n=1 Tax=Macleaya cordata TaxID=56857 RepID=A0A200PS72_MACCD|nr:hypothetical protein BVC80_989g24 [Macleaya cordata]